ncbi:glycosyltransferase, partial [Campylobacter coli]|nr:glycosyltransferase [Campylobacter coli]EJA9298325.1 glycosyltransferase [Campylobacter jejuni]EAJ5201209.1 glycosyltransferase [Campylobacter coli]ECS0828455.1 glycosyltransferase [Campylobacter coli]EDO9165881.1 glycosyltransferase [Campylobacter coli]
MKKVGVIVPIYNVENFLKECLESIINQSFNNLEIILVNDGSTDKNSFEIAKEYALKDQRITLFDKENGGLSSARNTGLEYFYKEYKLEFSDEKDDFYTFIIANENPQNVYKIYKRKNACKDKILKIPNIDYLIFLDSDNSWEKDCIKECVKKMQGIDVLWFDHLCIYEKEIKNKGQNTRMQIFQYKEECIISPKDYAQRALKVGSRDISFSWGGMIDFNFLKQIKLKFINYIINEDIHFGMVLFASANMIYVLPKKLYKCLLRTNSISNHDKKVTKANISHYYKDIYRAFDEDAKLAKEYLKLASRVITMLKLIDFFQNKLENENSKAIKEVFLPFYAKKALKFNKTNLDPLNLKNELDKIKPFAHNILPYDIWKILQRIKNIF